LKKENGRGIDCRNIKLIICDWDGVITELGEYFVKNLERTAYKCGLVTSPVHKIIGNIWAGKTDGKYSLRENARLMWPKISEQQISKYIKTLKEVEKKYPYPLIKGSKETLEKLKNKNIRLALCTANHRSTLQARLLAVSFSEKLFEVISTPDRFSSGKAKPHPYALLYVLEQTGVSKERALFVGDWTPDILAARKARISFIAVTSGGMSKEAFLKNEVPEERIFDNLPLFVDFFLKQKKNI
jgi:HAD superfamily hydrolase (TIGR01509 family)